MPGSIAFTIASSSASWPSTLDGWAATSSSHGRASSLMLVQAAKSRKVSSAFFGRCESTARALSGVRMRARARWASSCTRGLACTRKGVMSPISVAARAPRDLPSSRRPTWRLAGSWLFRSSARCAVSAVRPLSSQAACRRVTSSLAQALRAVWSSATGSLASSRRDCSKVQRLGESRLARSSLVGLPRTGCQASGWAFSGRMRQMRPLILSRRGSRKSTSPWLMIGLVQSAT